MNSATQKTIEDIEALISKNESLRLKLERYVDETDDLREKLRVAVEALGFYGDRGNWNVELLNDCDNRAIDDSDQDYRVEDKGHQYGGKRAREALKKIGEVE